MHTFPQLALLFFAAANTAFAWPSPQAIIPLSCLQLEGAFRGIDTNLIYNSVQTEVCSRNCSLTLSGYRTRYRDEYIAAMWTEVAESIGAPQYSDTLGQFVDDVYSTAEERCSTQIAWSEDICSQGQNWPAFATCVTSNIWPLILRNSIKFLPLLAPSTCPQSVELLQSNRVWTEIVPKHLTRYGQDCPA